MRSRQRFATRSRFLIATTVAVAALAASACDTDTLIAKRNDPQVDAVGLVDVRTGDGVEGLDPLEDGATVDLDTLKLGDISFRADTSGPVRSVRFVLDEDTVNHVDSATPWALLGDKNGEYKGWTPTPGEHTLTITPYRNKRAKGAAGEDMVIHFTVKGTPVPSDDGGDGDGDNPPPPSSTAPTSTTKPGEPAPTPAPTTTAKPPATTAPAPPGPANGTFAVAGNRIIGPDGKAFVPVGANFMGPHAFWPADTIGKSDAVKNVWRWNTIRVNMCKPGGCNGAGGWDWPNNNDLDKLVAEYTGKQIVVMLADHSYEPGTFPTGGQLSELKARWVDLANRYKNNPYVWYNVMNEPGTTIEGNSGGIMQQWLSTHQDLIGAIRGTGNKNIVVADGTNWGQEAATWDATMITPDQSAGLSVGPQLRTFDKNVVLALHVYGSWGAAPTAAERDARLANYIDRVHQAGMALLIGEVGGYSDTDGSADRNELGDWLARAAQSAYRVAPAKGVGIIAWHAQPGDGFALTMPGAFDDLGNNSNPTTLSWHGKLMWKLTHG